MKNKQQPGEIQYVRIGRRMFLVGVLAVSATGCQNMIHRGQDAEIPTGFSKYSKKEHKQGRYVSEICAIGGLGYQQVYGISLATELDGTGGPARASGQRDFLEKELKKSSQIKDVESLLVSDDTELIIIEGRVPPAARRGDTFDLKVVTMKETDATSLEGGELLQAKLRPMARLGRGVEEGHVMGLAEGRVLIDYLFDSQEDSLKKLEGVVLGGGKVVKDRTLGVTIQTDDYNQKTSTQIQQAINERFTRRSSRGIDGVAKALTDRKIELGVPANYRHNIGHYASVINQIVFAEPKAVLLERLEQLQQQIADPSQAALTALRLEAIGEDAVPILENALRHQDVEVRFRAAESLAYLGRVTGIEVLKETAATEPAFRWQSLTALASMNEAAATSALQDLLDAAGAETRYGAFEALLKQGANVSATQGEWLAGEFYLHTVNSDAEPMIHISRKDRAEIVVFGNQHSLDDTFVYVQSGLTVTANPDRTVTVRAYLLDGEETRNCNNEIVDVIRAMGQLGYGYHDQFKLIKHAKDSGALSSRLAIDTRPELSRTYIADLEEETSETEPVVSKTSGFDKIKSWFANSE